MIHLKEIPSFVILEKIKRYPVGQKRPVIFVKVRFFVLMECKKKKKDKINVLDYSHVIQRI
jgi:hypothetical protein